MGERFFTEPLTGEGPEYLHFRRDDILYSMVSDFLDGKPLDWPVVTEFQVKRVWEDFIKDGYVRDEERLDKIFHSVLDNVVRLWIATIVAGHDQDSPSELLEEYPELQPECYEEFGNWIVETEDGLRISDYGLAPLSEAIALAYEAKTPAARLKYVDRALNVVHHRGDLSKLFVAGGWRTVENLPKVNADSEEVQSTLRM